MSSNINISFTVINPLHNVDGRVLLCATNITTVPNNEVL